MKRREILLPETVAAAKHIVRATLSNPAGGRVSGILCGIFLPERLTDPIKFQFQPTPAQANRVNFTRVATNAFELAFTATTRFGGKATKFSAQRVWCTSVASGHHSGIQFVSDFTGEPSDLTITHRGLMKGSRPRGTFSLTPCKLINTAMIVTSSYTGAVRVRHISKPRFSLGNGSRLVFTKHFRHLKSQSGGTISLSELAAEFESGRRDISVVSADLDDFLLLTSLAARHRCVCLEWTHINSRGDLTIHYRRDIALPKDRSASLNDTLIGINEFPKFIRTAYRRFKKFREKEQFRSAIYPLVNDAEMTTEMSYFGLFSGLESALLFADRTLKLFPAGHQTILTRWRLFQSRFHIDVSDLWPLTDPTGGVTLAQLRNRVAHGEYLNPAQTLALMYAKEHLRWITERVMLTLLGWPIDRSKIEPRALRLTSPHMNWRTSRAAF